VSVVSFAIIHIAPGEPSQVDPLQPQVHPEMVERFRQHFTWISPCHVQYALFYRDLLTGPDRFLEGTTSRAAKDLGALLNSLPLFIVGTLITWTISFPWGSAPRSFAEASTTAPPPSSPTC